MNELIDQSPKRQCNETSISEPQLAKSGSKGQIFVREIDFLRMILFVFFIYY